MLERLGILMRAYFRQHDWVARYAEDAIAVLLPRTDAEHAIELAERMRTMVDERLGFRDHRSERAVAGDGERRRDERAVALGDTDRSRAV